MRANFPVRPKKDRMETIKYLALRTFLSKYLQFFSFPLLLPSPYLPFTSPSSNPSKDKAIVLDHAIRGSKTLLSFYVCPDRSPSVVDVIQKLIPCPILTSITRTIVRFHRLRHCLEFCFFLNRSSPGRILAIHSVFQNVHQRCCLTISDLQEGWREA